MSIETPCINVCIVNPRTKMCEGCNRTLREIAQWSQMPSSQRRDIMRALPGRNQNEQTGD